MSLDTIAVDLTPVLPGGENGGSKAFSLQLIGKLAERHPATRFLVLTQASTHEELAALDRANVQRRQVVGAAASAAGRPLLQLATFTLQAVPDAPRRAIARTAYRLHRRTRRAGARLLRDGHVGLLFCPFTAPTYREPGVATVCTVYDLQYREHPEFFSVEDAVQRDAAFADACRHADMLAAISDHSRDSAVEAGCDRDHIRTIHLRLAFDAVPDADVRRSALQRLGLEEGGYVLYPANFWKHKNHAALLAAFVLARERLAADVRLVLTGAPGEGQREVAREAQRLGIAPSVVFAGYLERPEFAALMAASRAVVFPSLYEGFGLPVLEAMACGVPVACSGVAALPEVAADAALLFDPAEPRSIADAIVAVSEDASLRARLLAAGLKRVQAFSDPDRMADEYWDLFNEAAARSAAHG